ncbi:MAG: ABC transporter permease subunit, partial [Phycisphaerales bacterium]|nr:ABC transporter permease subunit [Phycisphaerales bacterium]
MNALLAKLWLWVWHLLPANPILVRVVHGASRRRRHLWLRFAYLGIITAVVLWLQLASATEKNASLTELAKGASQTFQYAATTQLLLMCFLAPVFTASAITQERDAQTYNILLSTPLTSGQIVLGSLMSRLYFVIMLLLAGLPIFFMTMVYGGVTSRQIFESTALAAATAILTGALAIFIAMVGVGTRRTIFSFYLMIALYLLALFLFSRLDRTWIAASTPNITGARMSWLTPLHPFLALEVALNRVNAPSYAALPEYGRLARYALAYPSTVFVIWTTSLSLVLVVWSMYFVRSGIKTGEPTFFSSLFQKFRRSPAGQRTRTPRTVWSNPVAWREARTRASGG